MAAPLHERANGHWREILTALGLSPGYLNGKHGPCPACGGKDRFRFDDKDGSGSFFCNACGAGYGVNLVMKLLNCDFPTAAKEVERIMMALQISPAVRAPAKLHQKPAIDPLEGWRKCRRVWHESIAVTPGDPVWLYLENRGVNYRDEFRNHLRFVPRLVYAEDGQFFMLPAMVCAVTTPTGEGANILRTYLTKDGQKADVAHPRKLMSGDFPAGSSIRLGKAAELIGIAEGVETAIAASQLYNIPVWAAVNAHGLLNWHAPAVARAVIIFGDNDANGVGQDAAHRLGYRLQAEGLRVDVRIPKTRGADWNDVLLRGAA